MQRQQAPPAPPAPSAPPFPYIPARVLAAAAPLLAGAVADAYGELEAKEEEIVELQGAALLVDGSFAPPPSRETPNAHAPGPPFPLCSRFSPGPCVTLRKTLNEYMLQLIRTLHARGAEILQFAGDSVLAFLAAPSAGAEGLRQAAAAAVQAALEVRAIGFERAGARLSAHTGVGAGTMLVYLLRAAAGQFQALYAGDLVLQAAAAQRASRGDDIVLTDEARALLDRDRGAPAGAGADFESRPLPPAAPGGRPLHRLILSFCAASFPELDRDRDFGEGPLDDSAEAVNVHAARFGKGALAIVAFGLPGATHEDDAARAVRAALALRDWFEEGGAPFACGIASGRTFCGSLGAPCRKEYALIGDSVVRSIATRPPARPPAAARARRALDLIPGTQILAARLMGAARAAIGAARAEAPAHGRGFAMLNPGSEMGRIQEVLCDASVFKAIAARGRSPDLYLEAVPPVRAKGYAEPVPAYRPRTAAERRRDRRVSRSRPGGDDDHVHPAACLGRDEELGRVRAAVEAAASLGRGATLVIEGDAGFGKARARARARRPP
eukprot:tig00000445_g835.t1